MQQIYMQSDEQFEVFTTVLSPQVCRSRTRMRHVEDKKVVAVINYRAHTSEELDLHHGDEVQVLFKDEAWWFGRLKNGNEGYFPSGCVTTLTEDEEQPRATPNLLRRVSVPIVIATPEPSIGYRGGDGTPRLPRKNSLLRSLGQDDSPSLLRRILSKSRRKSCPHLPHNSQGHSSTNAASKPE